MSETAPTRKPRGLGSLQIRMLQVIDALSHETVFGVVPSWRIAQKLDQRMSVVSTTLKRLYTRGLVEPERAWADASGQEIWAYRLTEAGKKAIQ